MRIDEIKALDEKYFMHTFGERLPAAFTHGDGVYLFDQSGRMYTDFLAGIATNALGYAHPRLTEAICAQAKTVMHYSNLFYNEKQALLAEQLCNKTCADRVFIANSGAEANEGAIKLARKYFYGKGIDRHTIITASNSFHGRTLATLTATGQPKYQKPYSPLPPGFLHVPFGDIAALERAIDDKTCAIMLETIQGEGGVIEGPAEYIRQVRGLCDRHGLLLILDEIQTGMGRTGKFMSYEHYGIEPDIFTLAKALGGGLPVGALLAKGEVAEAFQPGDHGSTFGGNALACAAALVMVDILSDENFLCEVESTGQYFKDALQDIARTTDKVTEVRGKGLLLGMQLADDVSGKQIMLALFEKGYIINCTASNTLRFVPPLIIERTHIDALLAELKIALK